MFSAIARTQRVMRAMNDGVKMGGGAVEES